MKCLSLWQPWSSLLVTGRKRVETRGYPINYRGPLLIHAAKTWNPDLAMIAAAGAFRSTLEGIGIEFTATEQAARTGWNLPFGAILGRVDVIGCYHTDGIRFSTDSDDIKPDEGAGRLQLPLSEMPFGDYSAGRYAIICTNPVRFDKPIPCRGRQQLFDVPADLVAKAMTHRPRGGLTHAVAVPVPPGVRRPRRSVGWGSQR